MLVIEEGILGNPRAIRLTMLSRGSFSITPEPYMYVSAQHSETYGSGVTENDRRRERVVYLHETLTLYGYCKWFSPRI